MCIIKECGVFNTVCRFYVRSFARVCNYVVHIFTIHTGIFCSIIYSERGVLNSHSLDLSTSFCNSMIIYLCKGNVARSIAT